MASSNSLTAVPAKPPFNGAKDDDDEHSACVEKPRFVRIEQNIFHLDRKITAELTGYQYRFDRLETLLESQAGQYKKQIEDMSSKQDEMMAHVIRIDARVGHPSDDPTSFEQSTGLTKGLAKVAQDVRKVQDVVAHLAPAVEELQEGEELTQNKSRARLEQDYRDLKKELGDVRKQEEKKQEKWRTSVTKILFLLVTGGAGMAALEQLIKQVWH